MGLYTCTWIQIFNFPSVHIHSHSNLHNITAVFKLTVEEVRIRYYVSILLFITEVLHSNVNNNNHNITRSYAPSFHFPRNCWNTLWMLEWKQTFQSAARWYLLQIWFEFQRESKCKQGNYICICNFVRYSFQLISWKKVVEWTFEFDFTERHDTSKFLITICMGQTKKVGKYLLTYILLWTQLDSGCYLIPCHIPYIFYLCHDYNK